MRLLLTIFFVCIGLSADAQDTLFIKIRIADTPYAFYHAIFIDTSKNSVFRNRITDYQFEKYDSTTYFGGLQCLERPRNIQKLPRLKSLPRNWVPLFQYQGKYYTYHASDWCCIFRFRITDTTTMDHGVEGPEPSWIKQIKDHGKGMFTIERSSLYGGDTVTIHMIDPKRGIAILNFSSSRYTGGHQQLMVDANRAHLFPTIVNYCVTDRMEEVEFDPIDFSKLLKQYSSPRKIHH